MALSDMQQAVDDMVRDSSGIANDAVRDRAIDQARIRYSADLPREVMAVVVWTAAGVFGPAPEGWRASNTLLRAVYAGQTLHVAAFRGEGDVWALESLHALPEGAEVAVTYTTAHQLDENGDSIPESHRHAVACYAAWLLCTQVATHYSGQRETLVNADASDTTSRARDYAARAKDYRTAYYVGLGLIDPYAKPGGNAGSGAVPAAVVGTWPGRPRNRLTGGVL